MRYSGRFFIGNEFMEVCVEVDEHSGKITRIKKVMDGCKKLRGAILPAGVDLHVHFREPGYEHKEDFYTGSLSAAYGGITFVADMPNTNPRVRGVEEFRDKLRIVSKKANVDFALYGEVTDFTRRIESETGFFKWYMYEVENAELPRSGFISVHAELKGCISDANNLRDYDFSRPEKCEVMAIRRLLDLHGKFHIAHVSSVDSVDMCKIGRYTCEVTPHHLFLHRDMELGPFGKVNPPLRARWIAESLWELLVEGRIDIVASDHAPHTYEEKDDEFENAPPGIPEIETYLPMFLYLAKIGKIGLGRLVEVVSKNPAKIAGVKKGRIEPGYDGDFIAVDFSDVRRIRLRDLHYKCNWTPYEGYRAIYPHTVILRGEKIVEEGELVLERGGKFISSVHAL